MWSSNTTSSSMWRRWLDGGIGNETVVSVIVLLITSLTLVLLYLRRQKSKKLKEQLPPGPWGLPLLGYLPFLGPDLHKEFTKLAGIYGPIYKLWLGNKLCIVVNTPALVKEVVRDHDVVCANRDATVAAKIASLGAQDITFRDYSPEWTRLRRIFVRDMMGKTILDNLYVLRKEQVKKSIREIYADAGKTVDLGNIAFVTAFRSVMSMMLGDSLQEEKASDDGAEIKNTASELMYLLGKANVSDLIPSLAWLDLQGVKKDTERVTSAFENLLDSVIQQRKTANMTTFQNHKDANSRKEFVQFLLELHEGEDAESSITLTQLKALLLDTIIGGTDTTSTTVDWAMAELLKNPEAMKKVQQELQEVVGSNNEVEESHLHQLTYLEAVIKETLRRHPPLPLAGPRTSNQATIIGGYKIPKGTRIVLNVGLIQNDPDIWENASQFKPERFLGSINAGKYDSLGNNFSYLPFGSGRRVCPGISLADRMGKYMIASFLHMFEWRLPEGANVDLSDKFGIVVKLKEPVAAIPTPRFSNSNLYL